MLRLAHRPSESGFSSATVHHDEQPASTSGGRLVSSSSMPHSDEYRPAGGAEAVGFDLDQTLIHSWPGIMATWHALSRTTGVPIDLSSVASRSGLKLEAELLNWFPEHECAAAAEIFREHNAVLAHVGLTTLPGAVDAVAASRRHGYRVAVVTAKHVKMARMCLDAVHLEVDDLVGHVHGDEKTLAIQRLNAVIYCGDTPNDVRSGRAAGAETIGVATGQYSTHELRAAGAHQAIETLRDFSAIVAAFRSERSQHEDTAHSR